MKRLGLVGSLLALASCGMAPGEAGSAVARLERPACAAPRVHADHAGYFAFFDPHSAALSVRAELILNELAARWKQVGGAFIRLEAHTDAAEAGPADRDLAARRGEAVRTHLISHGVDPGDIGLRDFGSSRPMIPTPPGQAKPQNRFVLPIPHFHSSPAERLARLECKIWLRDHCFMPSTKAGADADTCKTVLDVVSG